MLHQSKEEEIDVNHVDMWKHYSDLRQKKHSTFLTANTILIAIIGFSVKEAEHLVVGIPILAIVIAGTWVLMLARNDAYIAFHRSRVGEDWTIPTSRTVAAKWLDPLLPIVFGLFWVVLLGQLIVGG